MTYLLVDRLGALNVLRKIPSPREHVAEAEGYVTATLADLPGLARPSVRFFETVRTEGTGLAGYCLDDRPDRIYVAGHLRGAELEATIRHEIGHLADGRSGDKAERRVERFEARDDRAIRKLQRRLARRHLVIRISFEGDTP